MNIRTGITTSSTIRKYVRVTAPILIDSIVRKLWNTNPDKSNRIQPDLSILNSISKKPYKNSMIKFNYY